MILLTVRSGFFSSTVAVVAAVPVAAVPVAAVPSAVVGTPPEGVLGRGVVGFGPVAVVTCVGRPDDGGPTRRVGEDPREPADPVASPDPDRRCGPG
jgi:hypothetical protein